jgi:hypothetical protein
MTRKHLELTAKLWALALVAHTDCSEEDELAEKVRRLASKRARSKLARMGTDRTSILNEEDAASEAARLLANRQ